MFSVNVLLYGDHPELATRCLRSIITTADWDKISEFRLGLNAVSDRTRAVVLAVAESLPVVCHVYEEANGRNVWKYPLMRRMFHDTARPLKGDAVMWFDDDSYIKADREWWGLVAKLSTEHAVVGSKYRLTQGYRGNQVAGIREQPWYTGKPVAKTPLFVTGGWWVCQKAIIEKWGYPFAVIKHNGGDSIFGELCSQQGYDVHHFNDGVAINADDQGYESRAKRRGDTTNWPWENETDLSHHNFEVKVRTFLHVQHTDDAPPQAKPKSSAPRLINLPGF